MSKEETRKRMEAYFRVYNSGDYRKALYENYTEDAVFENTRVKISGRDNIIEWFTRSNALGYKETLVPVDILVGEDTIVVELEQEFTAFKDVPNQYVVSVKQGETMKTSGVAAFYKLKEGRISSVRVYCTLNEYNPQVFMSQGKKPIESCKG